MSGESPGLRGILGADRERLAAFRALWRDFTGESAYEKYVERHRREHPGHAPMTEREFWRARARLREDNPPTGCC